MDLPSTVYSAAMRLRAGGRDDVLAALEAERARTLELAAHFEAALPAGQDIPYAPGLNPPRWEWGHVAWFQEWWLGRNRQRGRGAAADPDHVRPPSLLDGADDWYNSSVVAHARRWTLPLPDARATRAYLADTQSQALELLAALPPDAGDDALYFFRLAALHEAMHAEAAVYMALALGIALPALPGWTAGTQGEIEVPAQSFTLGWQGPGFAFDNELQPQAVALEAFRIDAAPVTSRAFGEFVRDGGLRERRWWCDDGWAWLQQAGAREPDPDQAADAPALHVSAWEAEAWCRWAGRRLPTEAEWECAALTQPGLRWGGAWEWTASAFQPWPGFRAHPYRDYSQPWFGARRVLRGACPATSPSLAHPRYRNFFEPGRTDVFSGFRSCAAEGDRNRV